MKTIVITLGIVCLAAVTAGTVIYLNRKPAPVSMPAVEPSSDQATELTRSEDIAAARPEPRTISPASGSPAPAALINPVTGGVKPDPAANALSQVIDTLTSPQASPTDRRALWQKLKEAGELDQVIAELKRRAHDHPDDPEIPTALGVGLMNKFPVEDFNEMAALGLQIDQSFDAALKLDPTHWEAQYEKAHSLYYWPDAAGKSAEIIQRLTSLAIQQDTMTPQPQFVKTYILLGDQYKKAGQLDYARQTWQVGAQKFPNDPALQKKIATLSGQ